MNIAVFVVVIVVLFAVSWIAWRTRWALTRSERRPRTSRRRAAPPAGPRFQLHHVSTHGYILRNDGGSPAYDVRLDTGNLVVHRGEREFDRFPPRAAQEYLLIQPLHGRQSEIVVRWRDYPNSEGEHTANLPLGTQVTSPPRDLDF